MRIALINGSPKVNNSASSTLLEDIKGYVGENAEVTRLGFHSPTISQEVIIVAQLSRQKSKIFIMN